MRMHLAAIMTAVLLLAPAACLAETWSRHYGGSREDQLIQIIEAGDGLLLSGHTASTDGNLSMRTREGKAGWLLRLDSRGDVLWSYCSAHVGRNEMYSPYIHADDTISATLSQEGEGFEWIHLDARGRLLDRVEFADAQSLCFHGGGKVLSGSATDIGGEPRFRIQVAHADRSECSHLIAMDGSAVCEGLFPPRMPVDPENAPTAIYSADGQVRAETVAKDGLLYVEFARLGSEEVVGVQVPAPQGRIYCVVDFRFNTDGTLFVSTQLENGFGLIARVSQTGEVLFCREADGGLEHMILTDAGFAGVETEDIEYYDEDGNLLAEVPLPEDFIITGLASFGDGAAALNCLVQEGTKENLVYANPSYTPGDLLDWYDGMIYTGMDMRVLEADVQDGNVLLLCEHRDGWRTALTVGTDGQALETDAVLVYDGAQQIALEEGSVRFESETFGARVIRLSGDGSEAWSMRTPIHTAADRLIWRCACQMADGSLALGGCYETATKAGILQEAVLARVSASGVLQEMDVIENASSICALMPDKDGLVSLVGLDSVMDGGDSGQACAVRWIGGTMDGFENWLLVYLEPDSAWLFPGPEDVPLVVGTSQSGGRLAAVVQWGEDRRVVQAQLKDL